MAASMATKIACMVIISMVVVTLTTHIEAITCGQIVNSLTPCLNYLRSGAGPNVQCCNGVRAVNNLAKTAPDRQTACGCLKNAATSYSVGGSYASSLPSKCGVNIPYKISPSTDCTKVQ